MRKGFDRLAALVQDHLQRDPFCGQAFVFRGRLGRLIKVLWWDGQGCVCSPSGLRRVALCGLRHRLERRP
jgi:transposase